MISHGIPEHVTLPRTEKLSAPLDDDIDSINNLSPGRYDKAMLHIGASVVVAIMESIEARNDPSKSSHLEKELLKFIEETKQRNAQRKSKQNVPDVIPERISVSHKAKALIEFIQSEPIDSSLSRLDDSFSQGAKTKSLLLELSNAVGINSSIPLRSKYTALIAIFKSEKAPNFEFKFNISWENVPQDILLSPTYESLLNLFEKTPDEKTLRAELGELSEKALSQKLQKMKEILGQSNSPESPYDIVKAIFSSDKKPIVKFASDIDWEAIPKEIVVQTSYSAFIDFLHTSKNENELRDKCMTGNISTISVTRRLNKLVDALHQKKSTESAFDIMKAILSSPHCPEIKYSDSPSQVSRITRIVFKDGKNFGYEKVKDDEGNFERRFYGESGLYFKIKFAPNELVALSTDIRRTSKLRELGILVSGEHLPGTLEYRTALDKTMIDSARNNPIAREWIQTEFHNFFTSIVAQMPKLFTQLVKHAEDVNAIVQEALTHCLKTYSFEKETTFSTYVLDKIKNLLLEQRRNNDFTPRSIRERESEILKLQQKNPAMSPEEIMKTLNITSIQYIEATRTQDSPLLHLNTHIDNDRENPIEAIELVRDDTDIHASFLEKIEENIMVKALKILSEKHPREHQVIILYYEEEATFKEIGKMLGVSQSRIYQLHDQAKSRLLDYYKLLNSSNMTL